MSETTATPSPPPPSSDVAAAGTALKVGIQFVKQYYKILSTQPEMVERFYAAPDVDLSYLSHGEGSEPTSPVPLEECKKSNDKGDHLSTERWGCGNNEKMLFELEDGAIDAQPSTNDGILLVVTACVIFKGSISEEGDGGDTKRRKKFVQTFFLAKFGRNFSVINDILRFLVAEPSSVVIAADSTSAATVSPVTVDSSAAAATAMKNAVDDVAVETKEKKIDAATKSKATTETTEKSSSSASKEETPKSSDDAAAVDEAPGGGVEETKEEAPDEEEFVAEKATTPTKKTTATKDGKSKKNKSGSNNKSQQQQPQSPQPAAAKPAPGSWASLVVSGGSAPNTPSRKAPAAAKDKAKLPLPLVVDSKEKDTKENGTSAGIEAEKSKTTTTSKNNSGGGGGGSSKKADLKSKEQQQQQQNRSKRDPDNTLVIKNLSDNVKEHDIINMFQPFAVATKSRIVGTNLNHHRNLAFVDYDCVAPVNAALKKHAETPFEWNGKVLEVDQKTLEQRARRKAGLSFNNNNNNGYRTGGGSGGGGSGSGKTGGNSGGGDQKDKRSGDRDRDRRRSRGNRAGTGAK